MVAAKMLLLTVILEFFHMLLRRKKYGFSNQQFVAIFATVVIVGSTGALIAHYAETGVWGIRYYGTVFCVICAFIPVAKWTHIPYDHVMDYVAPEGMIGIATMKISCIIEGCCAGKVLFFTPDGIGVTFPSQWTELIVAIIILITLVIMEQKRKKYIFPVFLFAYSVTRFVFDSLRANQGRIFNLGWMDISVGQIVCGCMILFSLMNLACRINSRKRVQRQE